jgi:hypothetical protein
MLGQEDTVQKLLVIECDGTIKRDVTSYGYQFSVDLNDDQYLTTNTLRKLEGRKVRVRIEVTEDEAMPKMPVEKIDESSRHT